MPFEADQSPAKTGYWELIPKSVLVDIPIFNIDLVI